jgi:acetyl-CoA acetyltransferase family protein
MAKADAPFSRGARLEDSTLGWRFVNPRMEAMYGIDSMAETAENVAREFKISRVDQDAFALRSQQRAAAAVAARRLREEIVPVAVPGKAGEDLVQQDEHPRPDTSMEGLARLRPIVRPDGCVTAGNASGINDGASAVLLMSDRKAAALGLKPLARVVASAAAGVEPRTMGLGPIPATRKALARAGLTIEQIGLIELNEAFAVQALAVMRELDMDPEITNVNGGAIALGHPLGCSGARILTTLLYEMRRRRAAGERMRYGLATLCVGVGQGEATVVELV